MGDARVSAQVAKAQMLDALKKFRAKWQHVRAAWDDDAARAFERDFIESLEHRLMSAAKGIDHVTELMAQVRRECGQAD